VSKDIHCPECGCEISGDIFSADQMRKRFFACLRDAHANLREEHLQRWPDTEAFRKSFLIAVGHCDVATICAGSKTAAHEVATYLRGRDRHCLVTIRGDVLMVYTARSMARRVLPKKQFLEVARRVFDHIAQTTGIDPAQSHEGRAA
jgi:hypothetical protein